MSAFTTNTPQNLNPNTGQSADDCNNVTPSDTVDLPGGITLGVSFAGAGALRILTALGRDVTIPSGALAAGIIHPIRAKRIFATNTTATSIVAFWSKA